MDEDQKKKKIQKCWCLPEILKEYLCKIRKREKNKKNGGVFKKSEAEKNIEGLLKITSKKNIGTNYKKQ